MNEFIEKLKTDKTSQLIVAGLVIGFIIFIFIFKALLFPSNKKTKLPCYQAKLKIWMPFDKNELFPYFKELSNYCLTFEIEEKSLEEIENELPLVLVNSKEAPDIVYLDHNSLKKYEKIFSTSTPIIVDTLVAYYNQNVLDIINFEKPKNFNQLQNFIKKVREYDPNFYVIGLGTDKIKNRKEIILSLYTLYEDYKDINDFNKFLRNFKEAVLNYIQFSDGQSDFYSYPLNADEDILNFANEKLAIFIGFYEDKKELFKINSNLNFSIDSFPLNTFPPKGKVYSKIYYLASLKNKKTKASDFTIKWFVSKKLSKFVKQFDLVPFNDFPDLPEDKKIVVDSVKKFGETFDFFNKDFSLDKIDYLINAVSNDQLFNKTLNEIYYSK